MVCSCEKSAFLTFLSIILFHCNADAVVGADRDGNLSIATYCNTDAVKYMSRTVM